MYCENLINIIDLEGHNPLLDLRTVVNKDHYSDKAKGFLSSYVLKTGFDRTGIQMVGHASLVDLVPEIQAISSSYDLERHNGNVWYGTKAFYASIVSAQFGDEVAINKLFSAIEEKTNERITFSLLPQIASIRQPKAVAFLNRTMFSTDEISGSIRGERLKLSYYAAFHLSKILKGFPVHHKKTYFFFY